MTAPPVVTLFEKYGAGARSIGPRVADALGVAWMDQAFSSADIESAKYPGAAEPSEQGVAWRGSWAALPLVRRSGRREVSLWLRPKMRRWLRRTPVLSRKRPPRVW